MRRTSPPPSASVALQEQLACLRLRRLCVENLIRAMEIYLLTGPRPGLPAKSKAPAA